MDHLQKELDNIIQLCADEQFDIAYSRCRVLFSQLDSYDCPKLSESKFISLGDGTPIAYSILWWSGRTRFIQYDCDECTQREWQSI